MPPMVLQIQQLWRDRQSGSCQYNTIHCLQPIFTSKIFYGMQIITDPLGNACSALERFHHLHRLAMKAALRLPRTSIISDGELWEKTGQKPIAVQAKTAILNMAWKCVPSWETHSLLGGRVTQYQDSNPRLTRLSRRREFPLQEVDASLISKLIEGWELLPDSVRDAKNPSQAEKLIRKL
jgi:hypothetical protein